ncbi:hypothetical protein [Methylobacterium sp. Leaf86]|uniref:hypothetical protein n=1 Tax=Methylobacterium sp. Leaf86 TaxID=1736242 RepID=UPI00138EF31E|nr:hypothetical protein [Methylobacterium sp. Leaf86]
MAPDPLPDLFRDLLDAKVASAKPVAPVPAQSDLNDEERAALDSFAAGWIGTGDAASAQRRRWEAYIEHGAHALRRHEIAFAKRSKTDAAALVTRTRLGFTSGWSYGTGTEGAADGGALVPMCDAVGWYVWRTRDSALRDGLHHLWLATRDRAPAIARAVQAHCELVDRIDVTIPPPEEARRRLIARADLDAAAARALQSGAPDVPEDGEPSEDRKAFEWSSGLTDVDGPPADKPTPVGKRRESRRQREAEAAENARRNRELPPLDPGVVMREPELADQVEVKEALYDVVPRGVPHFQKATLAVHRSPGKIIADVRLFDDEIGRVEITGPKGGRGYRWHHSGVAGTAFNWNEGARCWERIPDPSELA